MHTVLWILLSLYSDCYCFLWMCCDALPQVWSTWYTRDRFRLLTHFMRWVRACACVPEHLHMCERRCGWMWFLCPCAEWGYWAGTAVAVPLYFFTCAYTSVHACVCVLYIGVHMHNLLVSAIYVLCFRHFSEKLQQTVLKSNSLISGLCWLCTYVVDHNRS